MKIIGIEFRVGTLFGGCGGKLFEAKLVPVEIEFPDSLMASNLPCGPPAFNLTVHTSDGDATTQIQALPYQDIGWERARQLDEKAIRLVIEDLSRRVARA